MFYLVKNIQKKMRNINRFFFFLFLFSFSFTLNHDYMNIINSNMRNRHLCSFKKNTNND